VLVANAPPTIDSVVPRIVVTDSGAQTIALHGSGFIPGSQIEIREGPFSDYSMFPVDTLPTTRTSDSLLTAVVPPSLLHLGWRLEVMVRAPQPTARPSIARIVPVRTSGIQAIDSLPGPSHMALEWDSLRSVFYAIGPDVVGGWDIVAIDPTTNAVLRSLTVPDPSVPRIQLDEANTHLYVRTEDGHLVTRIDLATWSVEWTISMGEGPGGIPRVTPFVMPLTGAPGRFAVAPNLEDQGRNIFTVYDDSTPRAWRDTLDFPTRYGRSFGDSVVIITFDSIYSGLVTDSSLDLIGAVPLAQSSLANGVILDRSRMAFPGRLIDLLTGATVSSSTDLDGIIVAGHQADRYFIVRSDSDQYPFYSARIRRIDRATGALHRTVGFDLDYQGYVGTLGIDGSGVFLLGTATATTEQVLRMQTVLTEP
jgi:hypothetical protein